jgi:anthranilate phosphoribosyltransferase
VLAKHGNALVSSQSGSADVLEALGVKIDLPPENVENASLKQDSVFCLRRCFILQ